MKLTVYSGNYLGKLWNAAVKMVQVGWLTGSGEGSPGFMYYAFEEDLGAMERISEIIILQVTWRILLVVWLIIGVIILN